jgi:hypothetical protein
MPKKLHRSLLLSAERLGLKGKRKEAYVFGTMRKIEQGQKPKPKRSK